MKSGFVALSMITAWKGVFVTNQTYMDPTQEQGRDFVMRGITGGVVMLNLLRFRAIADYSTHPELAPAAPITGEAAYDRYMEHTLPFLKASGGEVLFYGQGGAFLVGPLNERWDAVMLVRHRLSRLHQTKAIWRESGIALRHWKIRACSRSCSHKPEARCGRCRRRSIAEVPLRVDSRPCRLHQADPLRSNHGALNDAPLPAHIRSKRQSSGATGNAART